MFSIVIGYHLIRKATTSEWFLLVPHSHTLQIYWSGFTIDCMAIGGFVALLLFENNKILKYLLNQTTFYISLLTTITFLYFAIAIPYINSIVYSTLYAVIILNLSSNKNLPFSLENKVFKHLGNISYGLYMLHPLAVVATILIGIRFNITTNLFIYPVTVILTILIASFSYQYFEKWFLKRKHKYAVVDSGSN